MTFAIVGSLVVLPVPVPWSIGAVCVAPAPSIAPFRNCDVSMSVSASRSGSSRRAKSSRSVITSPPFIEAQGVAVGMGVAVSAPPADALGDGGEDVDGGTLGEVDGEADGAVVDGAAVGDAGAAVGEAGAPVGEAGAPVGEAGAMLLGPAVARAGGACVAFGGGAGRCAGSCS